MQARTVRVDNISDLTGEREIREFFSFSGDIEHLEVESEAWNRRVAFVTFVDPKALEIALLLSGATIVDQIVRITAVENYVPRIEKQILEREVIAPNVGNDTSSAEGTNSPTSRHVYVSKAQDVVSNMLAKGSALRHDAINKAKAFDEKHQLRANASAKVHSFDKRVGLSDKITVGISVVNEKVKTVDRRLHVSDKTMAALVVAERKLNETGTAVRANRYVTAGTSWLNGAFGKMTKVGHVASSKTREKFQLAVSNLTVKDPIMAA